MAEVENPVKVDVPALTGTCQSDDSEDVWKQLYTKVFSSIPTRDGSWKENFLRTEKMFRQFADKFTEEESQGDPKYVSYKAQADGVIETIQDYFRSLSPEVVEKWKAWANLRDPEYRHIWGGDLFGYDEKLAGDRDRVTFKLLKIMWAVDKRTWEWIKGIPGVKFGDDVCDKASDVEDFFKMLFLRTV